MPPPRLYTKKKLFLAWSKKGSKGRLPGRAKGVQYMWATCILLKPTTITVVARIRWNSRLGIFLIQPRLNHSPRVEPRTCYLGALTVRLEALWCMLQIAVKLLLLSIASHIEISFFVWFTSEHILACTKILFSEAIVDFLQKKKKKPLSIICWSLFNQDVTLGYCVLVKLLFDSFIFKQVNYTKRDLHNFLIRKLYRCSFKLTNSSL